MASDIVTGSVAASWLATRQLRAISDTTISTARREQWTYIGCGQEQEVRGRGGIVDDFLVIVVMLL